jgi:ABC-type lipoprotein export system ATPase subunit
MSEQLIVLRGVGKHYTKGQGRVTVHENVNLSIPAGSFVALMGPSGCGKTTLLIIVPKGPWR